MLTRKNLRNEFDIILDCINDEHGDERWDAAMLVRQSSRQSFLAFATNQDYLAGIGHRVAALFDSRILPLTQRNELN